MIDRVCDWCKVAFAPAANQPSSKQRFCSVGCRQTAHRIRRRFGGVAAAAGDALTFEYADPPYPGTARKYYGDQPSYGGEVDHQELVAGLEARRASGAIAGWALSTSEIALRRLWYDRILPLEAHVCPWIKPDGAPPRATFGLHNRWEPIVICGGRAARGGVYDFLSAPAARGGGTLPGRKPLAFCAFLFRALGMLPGDTLVDLFPGTGVVGRAWAELCAMAPPSLAAVTPCR